MYVLSWRTVSVLIRMTVLCLFPSLLHNSGNKHKNSHFVSAETVRHESTYIIPYSSNWGQLTVVWLPGMSIWMSNHQWAPTPPRRRQAINWTNAGILLIRTLGTNFNEILNEIHTFSFKNMHLKMLSAKWRQFCLGLKLLAWRQQMPHIAVSKLPLRQNTRHRVFSRKYMSFIYQGLMVHVFASVSNNGFTDLF